MDGGSTSKAGGKIPIPLDKLPEYKGLGPYARNKQLESTYYCFVPKCKSTSKTAPEKMFIHVPLNRTRRQLWASLAGRDLKGLYPKSNLNICEDHFDIQNDIENYMQIKLGFTRTISFKPGAFPQYFDCQDRNHRPKAPTSNSPLDIQQRQELVLEAIRNREYEIEKESRRPFMEVTTESLEAGKFIVIHRDLLDIRCDKSTQTDIPRMLSKGNQVRPLICNKGSNTVMNILYKKTKPQASQTTNSFTKRRKLSHIPEKLYYSDVYSSSSSEDENTRDEIDDKRDPLFIINENRLDNSETRSSTDSSISDTDEKM